MAACRAIFEHRHAATGCIICPKSNETRLLMSFFFYFVDFLQFDRNLLA